MSVVSFLQEATTRTVSQDSVAEKSRQQTQRSQTKSVLDNEPTTSSCQPKLLHPLNHQLNPKRSLVTVYLSVRKFFIIAGTY